MERIDLTTSEEKSFKNADDGRQTDGRTPDARLAPVVGSFYLIFLLFTSKKYSYNKIVFHQSSLSYLSKNVKIQPCLEEIFLKNFLFKF